MSSIKCWYCKLEILDKSDISIYEVESIKGDKLIKRKFHKESNCYEAYKKEIEDRIKKEEESKREFNEEWIPLYEYVKKDILGYSKEMQLSSHERNRLLSLRNGTYINRGKMIKMGYPYKIILTAFKIKKNDIIRGISGRNFNNENHKFDYIMAIVSNVINDVYIRHMNREKQIDNLENTKINIDSKYEFKNNSDIENNKVASLLEDLF